jgi:hypothetical protein
MGITGVGRRNQEFATAGDTDCVTRIYTARRQGGNHETHEQHEKREEKEENQEGRDEHLVASPFPLLVLLFEYFVCFVVALFSPC